MSDKDEHVYDDIRELDNPMPAWWLWTFFATIVFSYFYIVRIHAGPPEQTILDAYAADMREFAKREAALALAGDVISEESLEKLMRDTDMMSEARAKFVATCAVCHGEQGQGIIGPNLTDNAWKNCEGDLLGVYTVVDKGVPTKGMPAWGKQLSPIEVRQIAAFVGTLRGTNIANGKAPEGHIVGALVQP